MKNQLFRFTLFMLICLSIPIMATAQTVTIPDPNLRDAIETALGKVPGDPILADEMATLTTLWAANANIRDLTGLEGATNLTMLGLGTAYVPYVRGSFFNSNSISDLSALAGLTNLKTPDLEDNLISDLSALASLTNLTYLSLNGNNITNVSVLAGLTNLTSLVLTGNMITDISALAGLTNLEALDLGGNSITNFSALSGLINLKSLWLNYCNITDISALAGLTNLTSLNLWSNSISDLSPLLENTGLGGGDTVRVGSNPLSYSSIHTHIPTLQSRGVKVDFYDRTPATLEKISGVVTVSDNVLIVEVRGSDGLPFEGVPVTFTVISGGGTLSVTNTTTDGQGRAQSQLTLGSDGEPNRVEASDAATQQRVIFRDVVVPTVAIPDPNLRAAIEAALGKALGDPIPAEEMATLTELHAPNARISDLTGLEHATNLIRLGLGSEYLEARNYNVNSNSVSDVSALAGLTNLTTLFLWGNSISDISALAGLTNLKALHLGGEIPADFWYDNNLISDISALAGLTNLAVLHLGGNSISDISALAGLTNLKVLHLGKNSVSDLSVLAGLTNLTSLDLRDNKITDLSPLVENMGLGGGDEVPVWSNPLSYPSLLTHIPTLQSRGVTVKFHDRTPTLRKISGVVTVSDNVLIVEVGGGDDLPFEGVPVTFTVISGGGTLSVTSISTDEQGRAQSQLTLGSDGEPNRVEVSIAGTQQRVTFSDMAAPAVVIPDPNLRAAIEAALGKASGDPILADEMANLSELHARGANISDLTGLEHATNLIRLSLGRAIIEAEGFIFTFNSISDISALTGLTNLADLSLSENRITDISPLSGLTNLTSLYLRSNSIWDISALAGLTNLTSLNLGSSLVSDISALAGLTNLTSLNLGSSLVSDISVLAGLTSLTWLDLERSSVSDLSPLEENTGLGREDEVDVQGNPLNYASLHTHIPALENRGVRVWFYKRTRANLVKITGEQHGSPSAPLSTSYVVQVRDSNSGAFPGVPVTFSVTAGGGTLSTQSTTTDEHGRAESTLTLGPNLGRQTVEVSAAGIEQTVTFVAVAREDVIIPDANLRAAVGAALGMVSVARIDPVEMVTLTDLDASEVGISNLTGLELATNLTGLNLEGNRISDISALAGLTNLTSLSLSNNRISDISALAGLTNLTSLSLSNNRISDISALAGLTNLTSLSLSNNMLSDISTLLGLTSLTELVLRGNSIRDISALAGLTNLTSLNLERSSVSDISALAGLTNLTSLSLRSDLVSDISALAGLTNLTSLNLERSSVSDISALAGLTNLKTLTLRRNSILDISALAGLTNLIELRLENNDITDLSPLAANTGLGNGDEVWVLSNPLSYTSLYTHIRALQSRRVTVEFDRQAHSALLKISGDAQKSVPSSPLSNPFVVEVQDETGSAIPGVSVTFALTRGGGTLSVTSTTTDEDGRVESTLTLGPILGTHTVEVSAAGIQGLAIFHAISDIEQPQIAPDVNSDGSVNILDLVLVASELGEKGADLAADVNGDEVINILDLVLVAGMLGDAAAAPSVHPQALETLTAVEVQKWLTDARSLEVKDAIMKRGIMVLGQLLVSLTPTETELLANYPNPFNPETWIPYRLAEDAFVTLTIYDLSGRVVRTLDVGHRIAAVYERRSKAAYWDGRNEFGERVRSGVYFYHLSAGDYSATRKMVILN